MKQKSIKKNYIFNMFYEVFIIIVPLITAPYVSRVLQADGVGTYSYAYSIATWFSLFAALGTNTYALREGAIIRDDEKKRSAFFFEITIVRFITTILSIIVYFVFIYINGYNIIIYLACSLTVISVVFDFSWFLKSLEDFKTLTIRNILVKLISVICIFTFVKSKDDLILYIIFQTGGTLIANLLLVGYIKKYIVKVNFNELHFKKHFRETLVYFIPTIATSIYTVLDKTMIGMILNSTYESGYYEQAHKIINILLTLITSLSGVIGARTSYLFGLEKYDDIKSLIYKAYDFMTLLVFPMVFGIIACADTLVPWFFGDGYDKVIPLLKLFSPVLLIISISNLLGGLYLTPSGQRARSTKGLLAGAGTNIIVNLVLIPRLNTYGAVIGTLCAESVVTICYIYMSHDFVDFFKIIKNSIKYLLFSIIMFIPIYFIGINMSPTFITTFIQIILGIIIYGILLLVTKNKLVYEMINMFIDKIKIRRA